MEGEQYLFQSWTEILRKMVSKLCLKHDYDTQRRKKRWKWREELKSSTEAVKARPARGMRESSVQLEYGTRREREGRGKDVQEEPGLTGRAAGWHSRGKAQC